MNIKLLEEAISHLSNSQANELKELLDRSRAPMEDAMDASKLMPGEEELGEGKPKGISVEKVSILGKKPSMDDKVEEAMKPEMDAKMVPGEEEMTDDELDELLKKSLS